jgi:hypothetical protein
MSEMVRVWACALLTVGLLLAPGQLRAQESHEQSGDEGEVSGEHGEHEFHRNHVAIFLGATVDEDESAFTLGADYERRFSKRFGIGVLADYASGDVRAYVVALPVFLHVTERLKFFVAAGVEDSSHGTESLVKLGVDYGFKVGGLIVAPVFTVDFVDRQEILVFGLNIGRSF